MPHDRQIALSVEILPLLGRETRGEATCHRVWEWTAAAEVLVPLVCGTKSPARQWEYLGTKCAMRGCRQRPSFGGVLREGS
jgi:hypothetical protein